MKSGSGIGNKNYSDLFGYTGSSGRSPRLYKNTLAGLKVSPRAALANLGNGSDKDSVRSRKTRSRQARNLCLIFDHLSDKNIKYHHIELQYFKNKKPTHQIEYYKTHLIKIHLSDRTIISVTLVILVVWLLYLILFLNPFLISISF